jgi:hypothetical protein
VHNHQIRTPNFSAQKSSVHNHQIRAPKFRTLKTPVRNHQIRAQSLDVQKQNLHSNQRTDQQKIDAKKDVDPNKILSIKKRLCKAKLTSEDIQNLSIKQWTSLKKFVEKRNKNVEKVSN